MVAAIDIRPAGLAAAGDDGAALAEGDAVLIWQNPDVSYANRNMG